MTGIIATTLYRLIPIAEPDDPNWGNALNHGEVIVRALSAGDARLVASEAEFAAITLQTQGH